MILDPSFLYLQDSQEEEPVAETKPSSDCEECKGTGIWISPIFGKRSPCSLCFPSEEAKVEIKNEEIRPLVKYTSTPPKVVLPFWANSRFSSLLEATHHCFVIFEKGTAPLQQMFGSFWKDVNLESRVTSDTLEGAYLVYEKKESGQWELVHHKR